MIKMNSTRSGIRIRAFNALALVVLLLVCCGCRKYKGNSESSRVTPDGKEWAEEIQLEGVDNFYKISDDLYRGAQPTEEGFRRLREMGIRTIVSLRSFHSDKDDIGDLDLNYHRISAKAYHPEDKELVEFLEIVSENSNKPVFIHCMQGSDRTGLMAATYRVAIQDWPKDDALDEMANGGFGHHKMFKLLQKYFREVNIEEIKLTANVGE